MPLNDLYSQKSQKFPRNPRNFKADPYAEASNISHGIELIYVYSQTQM